TEPFVRAVHPALAVVSCAAHNDYGHPHAESLARWQAVGARVHRTDLEGEIRLQSDGKGYHLLGAPTSAASAASAASPAWMGAPLAGTEAAPPRRVDRGAA